MSTQDTDRKIAVIFATDVVGYSKHMEKDEDATLASCLLYTSPSPRDFG